MFDFTNIYFPSVPETEKKGPISQSTAEVEKIVQMILIWKIIYIYIIYVHIYTKYLQSKDNE